MATASTNGTVGEDDPEVEIHEYLPKNVSYYGMIRESKYFICPSGYLSG